MLPRCRTFLNRTITTTSHIQRTANADRESSIHPVRIIGIIVRTQTIKSFLFQIPPSPSETPPFTFHPGQWLDVHVPNLTTIGGFSLTSSPHQFARNRSFELAIKRSGNPAANWFWTAAKLGDTVSVRVGGNFWYSANADAGRHVVLVAGGVGINPIMSIVASIAEDAKIRRDSLSQPLPLLPRRVSLLYTAATSAEFLFINEIRDIAQEHPEIFDTPRVFLTRDSISEGHDSVLYRRITQDDLSNVVIGEKDALIGRRYYVCGPPPMTDAVVSWLGELGVKEVDIKFERWW